MISSLSGISRWLPTLVCLGGTCAPGWAHSMYQGAALLDFHGAETDVELQLPLERVQTALGVRLSPHTLELERSRINSYILGGFSALLPDGRRFQIEYSSPPELESLEGAP